MCILRSTSSRHVAASLCLVVLLASGCTAARQMKQPVVDSAPVYALDEPGDPLVLAALKSFEATSSTAISGSIVGYATTWTMGRRAIANLAVMHNGNTLSIPSFGPENAVQRLGPEPRIERTRRVRALEAAASNSGVSSSPEQEPQVTGYIVSVRKADGTSSLLLVRADGSIVTYDVSLMTMPWELSPGTPTGVPGE